jgi:uncharacterized membrane protein
MKKIVLIGVLLLSFILLSSFASALQITNVKISGQSLVRVGDGSVYTTTPIISRALFEKSPTITFDVIFDEGLNASLNYNANILIGSNLYNKKGVWLGKETGNYQEVTSNTLKVYDPWLAPYVYTIFNKGDRYVYTIPLTPGKKSYSYTLQNPDILCFDAHEYQINVYASAYQKATSYHEGVADASWEYTSGDYSDDSYDSVYATNWLAQEFKAESTYVIDRVNLKLQRYGILPAGYTMSVSIKSSLTGVDLTSTQQYNNTVLNTITDVNYGDYYGLNLDKDVTLTKDKTYYIILKVSGGDDTHKLAWRKDTGFLGLPHYTKGLLSWCYGYSSTNSGNSWSQKGDTYMFTTSGHEIAYTYSAGTAIYFDEAWESFVFNTLGDTIDRTGGYGLYGWIDVSNYVHNKRFDLNNRTTSLFIGNSNPSHMKTQNSNLIGIGASFDTCSLSCTMEDEESYADTNVPLTVILCDKDRKIIDYTVVNSYMPILHTYPFAPLGDSITIAGSDTINEFRLLKVGVGKKVLESRQAYYMYVGVPSDTYNIGNTYITVDDTMKKVNWSTDNIKAGNKMAPDSSYSNDFMGAYCYFETQISYTDQNTPGAFRTTPSWTNNFVIWCSNPPPDGLGLPWFPVIIGFIPAIVIVGLVYVFMRKWEISIPNYIYSISATAGLYAGWYIGLLSIWIFTLIVASLLFISLYNFREPINKALEVIKPSKPSLTKFTNKEAVGSGYRTLIEGRPRPKIVMADEGIKKKKKKKKPSLKIVFKDGIATTTEYSRNGKRIYTKRDELRPKVLGKIQDEYNKG